MLTNQEADYIPQQNGSMRGSLRRKQSGTQQILVVVQVCNPRAKRAEVVGSVVQGQIQLHRKSKISTGYLRPCPEK